MKKVFEPVTNTYKNFSQDSAETLTEASKENNKALQKLNSKLLERMNDRCIIATYSLSPLSEITNRENNSQFKLVKDSTSNGVNDSSIQNTIPVSLYNNLLTFRDTDKEFKLQGDFLVMITDEINNVDLAYRMEN